MTAYWNKRLHAELALRGLTGDKKEYAIYGFTNGRTSSSKDLSNAEARELIASLPKAPQAPLNPPEEGESEKATKKPWTPPNLEAEPMRKRLIAIAYSKGKDAKYVKDWCERQGVTVKTEDGEQVVKKKFNEYTVADLKKLEAVFKKI